MSFSPSPQELALVSQLFAHADPQKLGILTGDAAVKAFQGANLSPVILGEVWALADSENNGFLTRKTAAIAVRLIGWAQKGETVSEALINKPGPLAHIEGVSRPVTSSPAPKSPTISSSASLPPLTPQDRDKFQRIFTGCGPVDGLLSGEKARDVFVKSKLPYEKLSQIWQLADTRNRGSLDSADFAVGMYLIQACMSNSSFVLPAVLPPSVYTQAGGLPPQVATHPTGGSGTFPSPSLTGSFAAQSIKPQLTGQSALSASGRIGRPAVPPIPARRALGSPFPNAAVSAFAPPPQPWDVSPEEKTTSDGFYDTLDTQHRGYIEGEVAVPFMIQSGLSEDILAQVWDLADIHNDGKLTRDGFAIAMHLINGQLAGKPLPPTLPPTLVPPSLRPQITGNQAPKPALSQVQQDLWGLDEAPQENAVSPPAAFTPNPLSAQTTGTNIRSPAFQPAAALPVHKTGQSFSTTFSTPFTPAAQAPPSLISSPPPSKDLLGDDEESATEHATIHANSVEIANTQNQLTSTERSLKSTQSERKTLEETLAAQASQLSALQSQLSTAKAAYEAETKLLATLRERLTSQNNDIQKTRNDLIRAESDLSAIKLEKSEIEGSFLRDKEEIRDLQRKMKEAGENIELLKADVEKAKKEARQQKGLLAIAKKQLGTSEAEKEKQQKELAEANAERDADAKETQEVETKIEAIQSEINSRAISPAPAEVAASIHIPDTPDMTSPLSTNSKKSTNPFEHLLFGGGGTPRSESPFQPTSEAVSEATQNREPNLVDDPFGLAEEPEQKEETSPPIEEPAASLEPSEPVLASKITTPFDEFLAESIGPEHKEEFEPPVASPLDAPVPGAFPSDEPAKAIEEKKTEFPELREIEPEEDDSSDDDDFHDANGLLPSHKTESRNGTPVSSKINEVSQAAQSHPAEAPIVAPVLEAPAAADVFAPSSEPWKPSAAPDKGDSGRID
ncbi:hypothetical protein SISSUDRAFT_340601 [Sistotremastrum suecicum HHB10207 ss-3]|uniref:EF-hand n=1 Tax=Sistotremastrum suecicum HHB10207 ss-3 TaxID=1314776 RepID=A0A166IXV0_9AGAM|nr:hypothetical protein SISSUDRAFT_340601 [Sistotremastrum suecicum HHB10207 ss-3]